eukprot:COSAG04_NODE_18813_length_432_cov_0.621622_1_plen_82_part_00
MAVLSACQAYSNVFSLDAAHGITNQPAIWMEADTTKLFAWNNSAHRSRPRSFPHAADAAETAEPREADRLSQTRDWTTLSV